VDFKGDPIRGWVCHTADGCGGSYNSHAPAAIDERPACERIMTAHTHHAPAEPSSWVCRWVERIPVGGRVLDVAAGSGRHARLLAARGHPVEAVDRDAQAMSALAGVAGIRTRVADIESGPWPYGGEAFAAVVVTHYLHRPLLPLLVQAVAPRGVLIYETFAAGNERFGRPSNPDFLLRPGELLDAVRGSLRVIAYEDLQVDSPKPAMVQRICAQRCPAR
jgi:SAM-dependent methyltransferase